MPGAPTVAETTMLPTKDAGRGARNKQQAELRAGGSDRQRGWACHFIKTEATLRRSAHAQPPSFQCPGTQFKGDGLLPLPPGPS